MTYEGIVPETPVSIGRLNTPMKFLAPTFCLTLALFCAPDARAQQTVDITVSDRALNPVDTRIFGQFLERASWGEPGPEAVADPKTGRLPTPIMAMLREVAPPVIRFPGGTDIDFIDWRDMIDNAPSRPGAARPVTRGRGGDITNRFGYHEYFELRDQLGNETILVLNLLDAVAKRKPLEQAAIDATGLVAYANAPQGARLPDGMPDWAAVRAQNGHPLPFGAEYVQIGNETWVDNFERPLKEAWPDADNAEVARYYAACVKRTMELIRQIDPDIKIIVDNKAVYGAQAEMFKDPWIVANLAYVAHHNYAYGPLNKVRLKRADSEQRDDVDIAELSTDDLWALWTTQPGGLDGKGWSAADAPRGPAPHIKAALTEWNWNQWSYSQLKPQPEINSEVAAGLGVAGFLHGLMRSGEQEGLATQSMLLGVSWGIAGIHADPTGKEAPYFSPQIQATTFYRWHHGNRRLQVDSGPIPRLSINVESWGAGGLIPRGALVDPLATRDDKTLYVHLINRSLREPMRVRVKLDGLRAATPRARLVSLVGNAFTQDKEQLRPKVFAEKESEVVLANDALEVELPPHSISVVEVALQDLAE